jgi:fluoride exporter
MGAADPLGFPPAVRLLLVTGFLGGLTTFSTFSAKTTTLLLQARYGWALAAILTHLAGSLCLTTLGVLLVRAQLGE